MSETEKGRARLFWQFWMEVGPDCALTELPKWGGVTEIASEGERLAPCLARLAATQFAETLMIAMGCPRDVTLALKDFVVNVEIKPR